MVGHEVTLIAVRPRPRRRRPVGAGSSRRAGGGDPITAHRAAEMRGVLDVLSAEDGARRDRRPRRGGAAGRAGRIPTTLGCARCTG